MPYSSSFQKLFNTVGATTPTPSPVQKTQLPTPTPQPKNTVVNTPSPVVNKVVNTPSAVVNSPAPKFTNILDYNNSLAKQRGIVQDQAPVKIPNAPVFRQPVAKPNTFLKGNPIQKAFDLLLPTFYGASGFFQGARTRAEDYAKATPKGQSPLMKYGLGGLVDTIGAGVKNIIPGVQQRKGISGEQGDFNFGQNMNTDLKARGINAMDNPYAQGAANLTGTFAVPLPSFEKGFSLLGKIPGVAKTAGKIAEFAGKGVDAVRNIQPVAKAIENVIPYFRNPAAGKLITEAQNTERTVTTQLFNKLQDLSKGLTPADQRAIGEALDKGTMPVKRSLQAIVIKAQNIAQEVGQQAVNAKLMKPETFQKMNGNYLPHIWADVTKGSTGFFNRARSSVPKIAGTQFKERKGAEGYIQEAIPSLFKGLGGEVKDINAKNLYDNIIKQFGKRVGKNTPVPDGFSYARTAINNSAIGKYFKGTALPNEVVDYLNKTLENKVPNKADKLLNIWKQLVTIYNPAYHSRNLMSNQLLSNFSTGKNTAQTVFDYGKSVANYFGKGDQKFVNAAKDAGLTGGANLQEGFKTLKQGAGLDKKNIFSKILDIPRNFQKGSEDTAKLNVFRTWVEKQAQDAGISIDKALKNSNIVKTAVSKAEEAIFSPYRIGQAEKATVKNLGIPFYSFARQAIPFAVKTAIQHPERIASYPKLKAFIESLGGDRLPNSQTPDNVQPLVRTPIKDKNGKNIFLDPTYILPYGNAGQGDPAAFQLPFGLGFSPFLQEAASQMTGVDAYTKKKFADSNIPFENVKSRIGHAINSFSPTFAKNLINKVIPSFQGKANPSGYTQTKTQSLLETLFGIKSRNYSNTDLEQQNQKIIDAKLRSQQIEAAQHPERVNKLRSLRDETIRQGR